jgi:pimeloyl-ACP methyl ester carboxylesterase
VIAPSHPGFGRSELPRAMTTVDDLAYFYLDVMDALDLRDVVLAGVSFGGWIAAEIAIKSTERLSHVVLADAVGIKLGDREQRDIVDIFTTKQSEVDRLAFHNPKIAAIDHASISDEDAHILFRNREATALFAWSPYMYDPKLASRLHRIQVPTLVLWGASDRIVSPDLWARLQQAHCRRAIRIDRGRGTLPAHRASRPVHAQDRRVRLTRATRREMIGTGPLPRASR